ncbi:phosphate acetyltransferase [Fructilactobacillus myrtifloralis]|uniref:Phosphate acetyltransferase n=1 Tax=Fructilactobacillus myrtifloralis TaxID=2940301 RepID=A0ABY5BMZ9_9LACO|nr:phosphate acetyltransferase [Fructilactobacillus myrtifloralis]USS84977.1 phosphate acetyltransferase [Fructilactobacillus myrtifloralis]
MDLFESLKTKVKGQDIQLVFPEGNDERIILAAHQLLEDEVAKPILLGQEAEIAQTAQKVNAKLDGIKILDYQNIDSDQTEAMVQAIVDRRGGKTSAMEALEWLKDPNYFGTTMVYMGQADGMVSGAIHPTGDTIRPALQIIKTKPDVNLISSSFIMQKHDARFIFADCAINIAPTAEQLAEIATESAKTANLFDIDPRVAMLSFSTKGSAKGDAVEKVQQATELAHQQAPELPLDGELQFDAALVPAVAKAKAPDSEVAGSATVFVFPDLQSGNIGYKIAQRLGDFEAIGPILQGLNKPVSDLSRGCSAADVYKVALITATQAL